MFKNYFKTAFRNLKRNKSYAIINVLGLTVGVAASLLIFLVIQYETSFDNFHKKKNSIYRVALNSIPRMVWAILMALLFLWHLH